MGAWALYREGKLVGEVVRLSGDIATEGKKAVAPDDACAIENLLRDFFLWQPHIPTDRKGKIDLKGLADLLAPLCRMLRDDVTDALKDSNSPLVQLAKDWRQLLFPDASDEQFADSYAQTVTFALLLGRSEGANPLTLESAESALAAQHNLLSRALQVLTDPGARLEMAATAAGKDSVTYAALFRHTQEQGNFRRLMAQLDLAGHRGTSDQAARSGGETPAFFSGNAESFSRVFSRLESKRIEEKDLGATVMQTVTYQWGR